MSKKSYNPFKLWGSYVGALIGLGLYLLDILVIAKSRGSAGIIENIFRSFMSIDMGFMWYAPLIMVILGFLIGYAIHALIRAIRR